MMDYGINIFNVTVLKFKTFLIYKTYSRGYLLKYLKKSM